MFNPFNILDIWVEVGQVIHQLVSYWLGQVCWLSTYQFKIWFDLSNSFQKKKTCVATSMWTLFLKIIKTHAHPDLFLSHDPLTLPLIHVFPSLSAACCVQKVYLSLALISISTSLSLLLSFLLLSPISTSLVFSSHSSPASSPLYVPHFFDVAPNHHICMCSVFLVPLFFLVRIQKGWQDWARDEGEHWNRKPRDSRTQPETRETAKVEEGG